MANSSIIRKVKNKIVKELIKDEVIIQAINSTTVTKPEKLIGTHIFDFNQNPYTIENVMTFITIQVHIPSSYSWSKTYIKPEVEIWIISHHKHMVVDNIPKVVSNRNDYLSELIDKKLNGRTDFGIGKLQLSSNVEGAYQNDYLFRKMTFETDELNNSLCDVE